MVCERTLAEGGIGASVSIDSIDSKEWQRMTMWGGSWDLSSPWGGRMQSRKESDAHRSRIMMREGVAFLKEAFEGRGA
jgi:hypothetical protein